MRPQILLLMAVLLTTPHVLAQQKLSNLPYRDGGHERHVLDVYCPEQPAGQKRPVLFWIHGGGWQQGDKQDVGLKPAVAHERGMVFVAANYRLLPNCTMEELTDDVAAAVGWVRRNIAEHGGDPDRIIIGGHSAGAQLAALICVDPRWLKAHDVPLTALRGCIPVDGDTYDIPKIIMTAEHRQMLYGGKMFTFGHRQKFGNDPEKHLSFSAVTHVAPDRGIPPFLLLYFSGNPDTTAQARRLETVLQQAGIKARAYGRGDTNHSQLNNDLGKPDDAATGEFLSFLDQVSR